jgi:hypothetical protein
MSIGHPLQASGVGLQYLQNGMLGACVLALDPEVGFLSQRRIAYHAGMSRQDVGVLGTKAVTSFGPRQLHLAEGNIQRLIESDLLSSD